jgi:hypothetical protein
MLSGSRNHLERRRVAAFARDVKHKRKRQKLLRQFGVPRLTCGTIAVTTYKSGDLTPTAESIGDEMFCRIVFGIDFGVANHAPNHCLPLLLRLAEKLASRIRPNMEPDGKAAIACPVRRLLKASYQLGSVTP